MRKWLVVRTDVEDLFLEDSPEAVKYFVMRELPVDVYDIDICPADGTPRLGDRKLELKDLETL